MAYKKQKGLQTYICLIMSLITVQQLKSNTSISGNVDPDKVIHLIDDAEVLVLEPALGTALYNKIVEDKEADTLVDDYLEIYNKYIVKILCYSVYAEYLRDGIILAQNTGIFENAPDDKAGADLGNVQYVAKANKSKADVYLERLERYLCDKNIPEYDNAQENNYDIDPREVNTISGWWLPRTEPTEAQIYISGGDSGNFLELEDGGNLELE